MLRKEIKMLALSEYRTKSGLKQSQLAELVGVTPNCISQWETGVRKPDLVMLKKLSVILQCTADDLLKTIETDVEPLVSETENERTDENE